MEVDGIFGQIGLVLHPLAPYYLFHIRGQEITNRWKELLEALPNSAQKYFDSTSINLTPKQNITLVLHAMESVLKQRIEPIAWLDFTIAEIFNQNGSIKL